MRGEKRPFPRNTNEVMPRPCCHANAASAAEHEDQWPAVPNLRRRADVPPLAHHCFPRTKASIWRGIYAAFLLAALAKLSMVIPGMHSLTAACTIKCQ